MKTTILILAVVLLCGFIFKKDIEKAFLPGNKVEKKEKKGKNKTSAEEPASPGISIREQWELPDILKEVSGIAYLGNDEFACVQDETGTIFIFNTASKKITKEIAFAGAGDFEGIAVKGNTAFVIRADGVLYEIDMTTKKTGQHKIGSEFMQNIESLTYDDKNNRLLLAGKDKDPAGTGSKGIYAFDISSNRLIQDPVFKIQLKDEKSSETNGKKNKGLQPSAIAVHPVTRELYILDGPKAQLMVVDNQGNQKNSYVLGKNFAQPEGLSFTTQGELYISNEGKKEAGNIIAITHSN